MKIIAIVQARMGSTRFPGKVLKSIVGMPMIEILLKRLSQSKELDEVVLATSIEKNNEKLITLVESLGFRCTVGSEKDVLNRYYESAKSLEADAIVRITGDCPIVDSKLVDKCIADFKELKVDYFSNTQPTTFPDGLDIEIMSFDSIKLANEMATSEFDREHVTPYIRNSHSFKKSSLKFDEDFSNERWTVDEPEDLEVVSNIFEYFYPNIFFDWEQVLNLRKLNPKLFEENQSIVNNEGALMGKGQKLYKRAKRIIPGGTMLLSKRPEMLLPDKWPCYFSKSKGCKVWDMDGKDYIDMSIMGIGTNILGYGNEEVDEAVSSVVRHGNMSTLNCPEEVYLAEKLVELHPWADMVRFARAGGEINSVAVRIARASNGRDKIAICGYHGWHDWYLSSNINSSNLDSHLLPGLEPNGVPKALAGTTLTFTYNNIEQLEKLIKDNHGEISAIKMEVSRNERPKDDFLQKVRDLATENNIILIFDECTSGFRETFGGLHKKYGVEPDMAIFAKALGNGYAISACIGKKDFMQSAQKTFISSTFWTERIGPAAALKTLEVMERKKSWRTITHTGKTITKNWNNLAQKYNLDIINWGLPALTGYSFKSINALAYKTFITQEMLKKGFLASNCVYVCTEHKEDHVKGYFEALEPIFQIIKDCEEGLLDIQSLLEGPICHTGFKRLN